MWRTRVKVSGPLMDTEFFLPMSRDQALDLRTRFRNEKGIIGVAPAWRAYNWLKRNHYFKPTMVGIDRIRLAVWVTRTWTS